MLRSRPLPLHVVAVHGNGGGAERFALVPRELAAGVTLHAVDLPGFGSRAAEPPLATLRAYAADLARLVRDVPRPRIILGHGIGGSIALELVQFAASDVDGLILHAPVGARLRERRFPRLMRRRWLRRLVRLALANRGLRPLWVRRLFRQPPPAAAIARFFAGYTRSAAAFDRMFDLITADWFESLRPPGDPIPTVLLWGGQERVLAADQASRFGHVLPCAGVEIVPGWDHFPMLEVPRKYAGRIARIARELVGPRALVTS